MTAQRIGEPQHVGKVEVRTWTNGRIQIRDRTTDEWVDYIKAEAVEVVLQAARALIDRGHWAEDFRIEWELLERALAADQQRPNLNPGVRTPQGGKGDGE